MTNWKALCAELLDAFKHRDPILDRLDLIARVCAALAQPDAPLLPSTMTQSEQQAVIGWVEQHINTNKALRSWRDPTRGGLLMAEVHTVQPGDRARAAMAQPNTDLTPADLSHLSDEEFNALAPQGYHGVGDCQPEPEGVTDEELWDLYQELGSDFSPTEFARAVLQRWGNPVVNPVPVNDRLPEPEDCDAEGRCWMLGKIYTDWRLISFISPGIPKLSYCFSHWLPYHALPVPIAAKGQPSP